MHLEHSILLDCPLLRGLSSFGVSLSEILTVWVIDNIPLTYTSLSWESNHVAKNKLSENHLNSQYFLNSLIWGNESFTSRYLQDSIEDTIDAPKEDKSYNPKKSTFLYTLCTK